MDTYSRKFENKGNSEIVTEAVEPVPVFKGNYAHLTPLRFNTQPVDDIYNTRLNRTQLNLYHFQQTRALLRLERFLRLRKYWLAAQPRTDEAWKTTLVIRGIFAALCDCRHLGLSQPASQLLKDWDCC